MPLSEACYPDSQQIEFALQRLNELKNAHDGSTHFFTHIKAHAKHASSCIEFFKKIKDPYAYIKLEIKNNPALAKNYMDLNNALLVLIKAQQSALNRSYDLQIKNHLAECNPYLDFVKKVAQFCEENEKLKNTENNRISPARERFIDKHPRTWHYF